MRVINYEKIFINERIRDIISSKKVKLFSTLMVKSSDFKRIKS